MNGRVGFHFHDSLSLTVAKNELTYLCSSAMKRDVVDYGGADFWKEGSRSQF